MKGVAELKRQIKQIDKILDVYNPGDLKPSTVFKDIINHRSNQNLNVQKGIDLASKALEKFPFNPELLRRRGFLKSLLVDLKTGYLDLPGAEKDLRAVLKIDPNNLYVASDLLDLMFHFSSIEDAEVAKLADEFAGRAQKLLEWLRSLEIMALSYADKIPEAKKKYEKWIKIFPKSKEMKRAKRDIECFDKKKG